MKTADPLELARRARDLRCVAARLRNGLEPAGLTRFNVMPFVRLDNALAVALVTHATQNYLTARLDREPVTTPLRHPWGPAGKGSRRRLGPAEWADLADDLAFIRAEAEALAEHFEAEGSRLAAWWRRVLVLLDEANDLVLNLRERQELRTIPA